MLAAGAYFTVRATENIVGVLGISEIVGGLFITGVMSMAPEVFATWSVARSGQVTSATISVIADNTVTMTVAFFPLALVGTPVDDLLLYGVNLSFVAVMPIAFAAIAHWGSKEHGFRAWHVAALLGLYLVYVLVMLFGVLDVL